ncbi:MAG: apolipoprotein N-acyltransferase [Gemmatimonadaceae bacterium]
MKTKRPGAREQGGSRREEGGRSIRGFSLSSLVPGPWSLVPALFSAALFAIAFPPFPFVVPAFICLAPLAVSIARLADNGGSTRAAAGIGFWFGFLGYACNLYWIAIALSLYTKLAILGYIASLIWLAPFVALFAAALFALRRGSRWPMAILLPAAWVALELTLNYLSDLSFPWLPLGLSVARIPVLAQIAELSGVRGVSFWIAATNGLLADAWLMKAERRAVLVRVVAIAGVAALVALYGAWRMSAIIMRNVAPIAVVQPNIPQEEKWQEENRNRIVGILSEQTRAVMLESNAELVVWPEVALPGFLSEHPEWRDTLNALSAIDQTPILFGVLDIVYRTRDDFSYFNAAMLADSSGAVDRQPAYHKEYLVPIVERVPFVNPDWFASLKYFGGYGRGADQSPYKLPFGKFGVLICYESIYPQLSREYRKGGADILVNITNDAWFGKSIAPYQHESHLALRAIENRLGIIRSANTGISEYVDPLGRVHGATPLFTRETRTWVAQTTDARTPYLLAGDWLGSASAAGTLVGLVLVRRRRIPKQA